MSKRTDTSHANKLFRDFLRKEGITVEIRRTFNEKREHGFRSVKLSTGSKGFLTDAQFIRLAKKFERNGYEVKNCHNTEAGHMNNFGRLTYGYVSYWDGPRIMYRPKAERPKKCFVD